jgi:hypothetical protein
MSSTPQAQPAGADTQARTHLEQLAAALGRHGWQAELTGDDSLKVTNPAAPISETVKCRPLGQIPHFWWPWNDPITPADKVDAAGRIIRYVLRSADGQ